MFVPVTCKVTIDARFYACSCAARFGTSSLYSRCKWLVLSTCNSNE